MVLRIFAQRRWTHVTGVPHAGWSDYEVSKYLHLYFASHRARRHLARKNEVFQNFQVELQRIREKGAGVGPRAYFSALTFFASGGNLSFCKQLWSDMVRYQVTPTTPHYNAIIRCCAKAGMVRGAKKTLATLREKGLTPDVFTYEALMEVFALRKDEVYCEKVFQAMLDDGHLPTLRAFTYRVAACRQYKKGVEVWKRFSGTYFLKPSTRQYNALILSCMERGETSSAEKVMQNALAARDVTVDTAMWNSLAAVYKNAKSSEGVEGVIRRMGERRVSPTVDTYATLLEAYAHEVPSNTEAEARAEASFAHAIAQGIHEIPVFTALAKVYAQTGNVEKVEKLREELSRTYRRGETENFWLAVKETYIKAGREEELAHMSPNTTRCGNQSQLPEPRFPVSRRIDGPGLYADSTPFAKTLLPHTASYTSPQAT